MIFDRVQETTATSGTGPVSFAGATTGFQTFVAGVGDGNECYYAIVDSITGDWEIGIGTVTDSTTDSLARDTVLQSSNSGSLVSFAANTKDVFVTYPSEKAVVLDGSGDLDIGSANIVTSGTVDGRDVSVDGAKLDTITDVGSGKIITDSERTKLLNAMDRVSGATQFNFANFADSNGQVIDSGYKLDDNSDTCLLYTSDAADE